MHVLPGHELIRVLKPEVAAGIKQKREQNLNLQSSAKVLNRSEETLCVMASCRAHAVDHDLDTPMALLWLMASGESRSPSGKFQI